MCGRQLPELPSEVRLLIRGQILVPEEDDEMGGERGSQHGDDPGLQGYRQVESGYLRTYHRGDGLYVEAHSDGHATSLHPAAHFLNPCRCNLGLCGYVRRLANRGRQSYRGRRKVGLGLGENSSHLANEEGKWRHQALEPSSTGRGAGSVVGPCGLRQSAGSCFL